MFLASLFLRESDLVHGVKWARKFCCPSIPSSILMLPRYHALPTSPTSPRSNHLSRLAKSSNPLRRLAPRWILVACITSIFLFLGTSVMREITWGFPWLYEHNRPLHLKAYPRPSAPTQDEQAIWDLRKEEVREAFLHAWTGYKTIAFPNDELLPVSGLKSNKSVIHNPLSLSSFVINGHNTDSMGGE